MNADLLTSLPLWILNLALAAAVFFRAPRKAANYTFGGFVLALVAWSWSVKMVYMYAAPPFGVWWARLAFATGTFVGMNFVFFCKSFPDRTDFPLTKVTGFVLALGLSIVGLSLTPWMVRDLASDGSNGIQITYGVAHRLFGIFLLCSVSVGIAILVRTWRRARGRKRLQIQYLCLGLGLFFAGATTTNVILPILMNGSRFSKYGPYFSLFVVSLTAHAIIRHRLMNIRLIVRKSMTYGLSLGIVGVVMWAALTLVKTVFDSQGLFGSSACMMLIGIGSIVLFHPLRLATQYLFDKYCYREAFDYRRATSMVSQELPLLMRPGPLSEYLVSADFLSQDIF